MYSFDVFDTLITRKVAVPKGIFDLMEYKVGNNFASRRIKAEIQARVGKEEITFEEIYENLDDQRELELRIEYDNIVGIRENIEFLKEKMNTDRVILISDMYLSSEDIRKLLLKVDDVFANIKIYVSSEYGVTKATGNLYKKVKELENPEEWHHLGDNKVSDVEIPCKLGIDAKLYDYPKLTIAEKLVLDKYYMEPYVQYGIGLARNLRIGSKNEAYNFGTIGGQIIYSCMKWMLDNFKGDKICFIARDGYIPKMVADEIISYKNLTVKTDYVYGSRKAWNLPSINTLEELNDFLVNYSDILTKEHMENLFGSNLPKWSPWNKKNLLTEEFLNRVKSNNENKRKEAKLYLKSFTNYKGRGQAFFDTQSSGYTLECLSRLLNENIEVYAFNANWSGYGKHCKIHNFYTKMNYLIEGMTRAFHGQTMGYKDGNPILRKDDEAVQLKNYEYEDYIKAVVNFVKSMLNIDVPFFNYANDLIDLIEDNLNSYSYLADMPFDSESNEEVITLAPKLTKKDIRAFYLMNSNRYKGRDFNLSMKRCNNSDLNLINFYKSYAKEIILRFKNIYHKEIEYKVDTLDDDDIFYNKRIVIYGAGYLGRGIYYKLKREKHIKIVAWLDRDYKNLKNKGYNVTGEISSLKDLVFDYVLITISKNESMKKEMLKFVDEERIVTI